MLDGLEEIRWDKLTHAYGQADGIPARIRALQSTDPAQWVRAMSDLYDALCHQMCSIYPATVSAIPFFIQLLAEPKIRCRGRIIEFLGNVMFVANHEPEEDGEEFAEDEPQGELEDEAREAIHQGLGTYLELLSDLDPRIRAVVPYLLGAMGSVHAAGVEQPASIVSRMKAQFAEEPNEMVRASLIFGLACLARHDSRLGPWLEERVSDPHSSPSVRMAAALNLAESAAAMSAPVVEALVHGLQNPDETNRVFKADQPEMETRHHPIGRAMLEFQGRLDDRNDDGADEDLKFPWCDRWQCGWVTFRILEVLSKAKIDNPEPILPALIPYLDQANEHTGDALVLPILRMVLGDRELSTDTPPDKLTSAERTVLLHIFNNVKLWATNRHQSMFDAIGLGNRRADWARLLKAESTFSTKQILEILDSKLKEQRCSGPDDVQEIRLCRIASAEFLPHLRSYTSLKILDLADSSISDSDLAPLGEFRQLRLLRLNNTSVTDAGIEHLGGLASLEELYIPGTQVTDRCLEILTRLPKLKYVSLTNTAVTDEAARQFSERRPNCRLSR